RLVCRRTWVLEQIHPDGLRSDTGSARRRPRQWSVRGFSDGVRDGGRKGLGQAGGRSGGQGRGVVRHGRWVKVHLARQLRRKVRSDHATKRKPVLASLDRLGYVGNGPATRLEDFDYFGRQGPGFKK